MAMKCRNCGQENPRESGVCSGCGKEILQPGDRAQVLATLIQSQDTVTWVAFSLAMTVESILLVGFVQASSGLRTIAIAGLSLDVIFMILVVRSNMDMRALYKKAANTYPDAFALSRSERLHILGMDIPAWQVMMVPFLAWMVGWIYLLLVRLVG
ncbi:MAG: hypothetical protein KJ653_04975 [Candidatus Thermoplasmatota archaeon]|nr:hypothetical protein [Candidatus Thermoplasmatota archaeon]